MHNHYENKAFLFNVYVHICKYFVVFARSIVDPHLMYGGEWGEPRNLLMRGGCQIAKVNYIDSFRDSWRLQDCRIESNMAASIRL